MTSWKLYMDARWCCPSKSTKNVAHVRARNVKKVLRQVDAELVAEKDL